MTLSIGSLFSGIGGLELGLEMTGGFHTLWQAERDEFARRILAKHWPHAVRFDDVRDIAATVVPRVDVLTGGFPCQPHSLAGQRLSSADERDLWGEFARIIGDLRPRWVVAENVPGLLSSSDPAFGRDHKGGFFGRVLRDLAECGYDAEWRSLTAASVGAHHKRARVFLVAYTNSPEWRPQSEGRHEQHGNDTRWAETAGGLTARRQNAGSGCVADAQSVRFHTGGLPIRTEAKLSVSAFSGADVADPYGAGREEQYAPTQPTAPGQHSRRSDAPCHSTGEGLPDWAGGAVGQPSPLTELERSDGREVERDFRGMAHGVSLRVDRLRTLGNAVVSQVAQGVGQSILEAEAHYAAHGVMPDQVMQARYFRGQA